MNRYLRSTFESLSSRNFALFIAGQSVSTIGTWMQKIAQAWLVLELTKSGTLLGVTVGLQQVPTLLLTPWGGLLADRVNRRRILLFTQVGASIPALALGILIAVDHINIWIVMVLALVLGTVDALDKPARHSFVADLVHREHLTNAVTINNIVINSGKVVGPAVAGILIATVGLAVSFFVNAVSFTAVVIALLMIRVSQLQRAVPSPRAGGQLRQGLRYVRSQPGLLGPLVLLAVTGLLVYEWTVTLPLFAIQIFDGDARIVGLMFTAMGGGAVFGGLAIAGALRATTGRLIASALVLAGLLLLTAVSPTLPAALILLFLLGAASVAFRTIAMSLVQLRTDPAMRGRMMALVVMAVAGTTPIGGPLVGWVAENLGARAALTIAGVATAAAAIMTMLYLRGREYSECERSIPHVGHPQSTEAVIP